MYRIAIGCDPNAEDCKQRIANMLKEKGYEVSDMGSEDPIYANTAYRVGKAVAEGLCDRGVLICGTGMGMSVAANKVRGVIAPLITDCYSAERARKSNDANVACFGAFTQGVKVIEKLLLIFLNSEFEPGCSSQPKVDQIRALEMEG